MSTREERQAAVDKRREARIAKRKEQERLIKEGVICGFNLAWHGPCAKPATNGRCEKHAGIKCTNCEELATRECDHVGMLVCGFPLCNNCRHPHRRNRSR
jgi:hypothetical protein